jgi:hypothetical protein
MSDFYISSRRWSASSKASSIKANVSTKWLDSLSLSNWFSSSEFKGSTGRRVDFDTEMLVSVGLVCKRSDESVFVWDGATAGAKGRLMTTEGGWRWRDDLTLVDERGDGGRMGCGMKRGEAANWDDIVFVDNVAESSTCLAFTLDPPSRFFPSRWLWLAEETDGVAMRFDAGKSLPMLAGAVRLRSREGAVMTLRFDDESLVTSLLVGATEFDCNGCGGEVGFVLKRLKRERNGLDEIWMNRSMIGYLLESTGSSSICWW